MLNEFKKFIMRGNVMDMAVGVIIGAAFGKIVTSLVTDIITPIISLLTAGTDFTGLKLVLRQQVLNEAGEIVKAEAAITYGNFIQSIIDFLIIALCIFFMIKAVNKASEALKKQLAKEEEEKAEAPAPEAPKGPTQEELLTEIRDLLKAQESK